MLLVAVLLLLLGGIAAVWIRRRRVTQSVATTIKSGGMNSSLSLLRDYIHSQQHYALSKPRFVLCIDPDFKHLGMAV